MVLPADESVAGSVKDRVTGVLAWPLTSKRPPFVRSVALTVLFTPGKTFPKLNCWAPTTLIGVWTLAVAVMLALFVWAWSAVPVRTRAATTRDSFVMLRISLTPVFGVELLVSWSAIRLLHLRKAVRSRLMPTDTILATVKFLYETTAKDVRHDGTLT